MNQYKFCGAFVIDDSKKTVRLPNYNNTFLMGGNKDNIGYSIPPALPNISGQFGFTVEDKQAKGAFSEFGARTLFSRFTKSSKKSII